MSGGPDPAAAIQVLEGDCRDHLDRLWKAGDRFDSCVTDPPYEVGFMGRAWDDTGVAFDRATWTAVRRCLRPGAYCLAFGLPRLIGRLQGAMEDGGLEVVDMVAWLFGSGFPKSLDVSKAIDKAAGAEPRVVAEGSPVRRMRPGADQEKGGSWEKLEDRTYTHKVTAAKTDAARQWQGWGTALKPAMELIVVARRPLGESTVAANLEVHGTGALNIDASRISAEKETGWGGAAMGGGSTPVISGIAGVARPVTGRWPANVTYDGSDEVMAAFAVAGESNSRRSELTSKPGDIYGGGAGLPAHTGEYGFNDSGSPARFFYCAKAGDWDRLGSTHPTIKPVKLIRWLARLVTPVGGCVVDPFAGSGTIAAACIAEGFRAVLMEREPAHVADIHKRIRIVTGQEAWAPSNGAGDTS